MQVVLCSLLSLTGSGRSASLVGMDQKDSSMVALVVSNGSYVLAGISGDDAFRAVFPSVFVWPRCSASWSVWARRTVMPCRSSSVGTFSRAPCIRQSLDRCLVCLMSSGFGFWEMSVPGSIVDDVHASFYGAFCALSHIFYLDPGLLVSGSHLVVFASTRTGKNGFFWEMTSLCSVCSAMLGMWYMYASVYGVEEFHVFYMEMDIRP